MSDSFPPPPFEGFPGEAMDFFRDLAAHQDRAWFAEHKPIYERAVQAPLASLVTDLAARLAERRLPLRGDPKRSVFRINRDVRFSNNKSPYKTHASAVLTRTGDKKAAGLLYIHLDPQGCFAAAGFFRPEPPVLHVMRGRLVARPADWTKAVAALASQGFDLQREDALVRPPKGFDAVPAGVLDAIKLKSWIVKRDLAASAIGEPGLVSVLADFAELALPLLQFGWSAIDGPVGRTVTAR